MKKYLYDYIEQIDNLLKDNKANKDTIEKHLIKINFFQHERLIHLLVTLFYSGIFLLFMTLSYIHYVFFIIALMLMPFVICYIVHYFRLENGVQYLYKQYDNMIDKRN